MNELALFAGAGGGILGGHLLGWRTVCAVEWEPYPASVLCVRQNEGLLPAFPIWDDVQTFDGRPWRGRVDVVSGGFPCQDISAAGKGAGIDGARSGMWGHMARIIGEIRPRYVFVENSPMLTSRGLGRVLGDLAEMGYDARWGVLGAVDAGAPHKRDRIWIKAELADANGGRFGQCEPKAESVFRISSSSKRNEILPDTLRQRGQLSAKRELTAIKLPWSDSKTRSSKGIVREWWATEPDVGRVAHGVAARVDRLKAIGNGQVSSVAALAWRLLS